MKSGLSNSAVHDLALGIAPIADLIREQLSVPAERERYNEWLKANAHRFKEEDKK